MTHANPHEEVRGRLRDGLRTVSLAALLLATGGIADPLLAAEENEDAKREKETHKELLLEEIVVTAEKREASLQDVPVSVTALTGDDMAAIGITTIEDVQLFVPGITVTNDAMAIVNIRGIGTSAFGVATDPSSTVHIDGVYIPRPTTGYQDMFDVERIELLRGPQGVLFGRNSTGGTLNIITRLPADEFEGTLGVTVGNLSRRKFSGTVSGPLGERVRARVTLMKNDRDGRFRDVLTGREYQNQDTFAGRAVIAIDVTDRLEFILRGDVNIDRENGYPAVLQNYRQDLIDAGAVRPANPKRQIALDAPVFQNVDNYGVSNTAIWTGDTIGFKSITSWRRSKYGVLIDVDSTNLFLRNVGFDERSKSFTQELQLYSLDDSRLEWIFGLYYLREDGNDNLTILDLTRDLAIPGDNTTNAYAAFGQVRYHVTDALRATFGLRYSYEKKNFAFGVLAGGVRVVDAANSADWDAWTPKFGLDYHVSDDVMVYATASRGFKSGGFQVGEATPFDPEFLWSYEAGVKSFLADRRLQANIGTFYYDFSNLQVVQIVNGISTTNNAGKAVLKGFEAEFLALPSDALTINASVAYLDATYRRFTEVVGGVEVSRRGNTLPNSPKWKIILGAEYVEEFADGATLTLRGDFSWQDDVFFRPSNLPQFSFHDYAVINTRVSYRPADGRWEIAFYGRNLTDANYQTYRTAGIAPTGISDENLPLAVFGEPREYGLQVIFDF